MFHTILLGGLIGLGVYYSREYVARVLTGDKEVVPILSRMLGLYSIGSAFDLINPSAMTTWRSLGKMKYILVIFIVFYLPFCLGVGYYEIKVLNMSSICLVENYVFTQIIMAVVVVVDCLSSKWRPRNEGIKD